jgi:hypothetical protein
MGGWVISGLTQERARAMADLSGLRGGIFLILPMTIFGLAPGSGRLDVARKRVVKSEVPCSQKKEV